MGFHYEVADVLAAYDNFYPPLIIGMVIAMIVFFWYYVRGIIQGFRDKCGGMPWQTNMWNFSNDIIFVAGFWSWFNPDSPTHHWTTIILWTGMVIWFIMEFIVHYQSIKWDLQTEIFPHIKKRRNAIWMYWGVQACFVAAYAFFWSILDDPLVYFMFMTTFTGCLVFNFSMSAKRGSRRGMAASIPWGLLIAQFCGYFLILPSLSATLLNPYTICIGIVTCSLAVAYIVMYYRLPKYTPAEMDSAPADTPEPVASGQ